MITMLQKEEDSRTKNDFTEIMSFIGLTHFINNSGYDLDESEKWILIKQAQYVQVNRGEKFYKRGDKGKSMYFIIKGEVAVTFPTAIGE